MIRFMLDSKICIYTIKNRPAEVRDRFNRHSQHLCISAITLAELMFGAEKSAKASHNLAVVESFSARLETLAFDEAAATHYGQICADLERQGQPIGPNDLMIAAHARSRSLVLVTNNEREFQRIDGLRLENWLAG
jgi:tRNA(fMet)-specific endonuclease VapC